MALTMLTMMMMMVMVVFHTDCLLIPILNFSPVQMKAQSTMLAVHLFFFPQLAKKLLIVLWWTLHLNHLHFHSLYQPLQ